MEKETLTMFPINNRKSKQKNTYRKNNNKFTKFKIYIKKREKRKRKKKENPMDPQV